MTSIVVVLDYRYRILHMYNYSTLLRFVEQILYVRDYEENLSIKMV